MKTLANCNPREFLVQTNKIRKRASEWLTMTQILEIRKHQPETRPGMTKEELEQARENQVRKNLMEMLDRILDDHPNETAELLGLLCFIEPDDLENHRMTELLEAATEVINCPEVLGFFSSLIQLGQSDTSPSATK